MSKLSFLLCVCLTFCLFLSAENKLHKTAKEAINTTLKNKIRNNTVSNEQNKPDCKKYCFTPDCHADFNEGKYEIHLKYIPYINSYKSAGSYKRLSLRLTFRANDNKTYLISLSMLSDGKWREIKTADELFQIREVLAAASNSQDFLCYRMVMYYFVNKMRENYFVSYQKALEEASDTEKQGLSVEKKLYFNAQSELIDNFSLFCGLKDNKTSLDNVQKIASSISGLLDNLTYMDIQQLKQSNKTDGEMLPKKTKIYNDSIYKIEPFDESYCFTPEFRSIYGKGACEVHLKYFVMDANSYYDQLSVKAFFDDVAGKKRLRALRILDGNEWRQLKSGLEYCKIRDVLTVANRSQCFICYSLSPKYFDEKLSEYVAFNRTNANDEDLDLSPEKEMYFSAQDEFVSSFFQYCAFKWHHKDLFRLNKVINCLDELLEGKTYKDIRKLTVSGP